MTVESQRAALESTDGVQATGQRVRGHWGINALVAVHSMCSVASADGGGSRTCAGASSECDAKIVFSLSMVTQTGCIVVWLLELQARRADTTPLVRAFVYCNGVEMSTGAC